MTRTADADRLEAERIVQAQQDAELNRVAAGVREQREERERLAMREVRIEELKRMADEARAEQSAMLTRFVEAIEQALAIAAEMEQHRQAARERVGADLLGRVGLQVPARRGFVQEAERWAREERRRLEGRPSPWTGRSRS